jgi:hypothetical protein
MVAKNQIKKMMLVHSQHSVQRVISAERCHLSYLVYLFAAKILTCLSAAVSRSGAAHSISREAVAKRSRSGREAVAKRSRSGEVTITNFFCTSS